MVRESSAGSNKRNLNGKMTGVCAKEFFASVSLAGGLGYNRLLYFVFEPFHHD